MTVHNPGTDGIAVDLSGYQLRSEKAAANGYASLGSDGIVPAGQLPLGPASAILVNVKDYGALGDGVANDTSGINDGIAAVTALGGTLYFPPGTYRVSSTIVVPGGVTLRGAGIDYAGVSSEPARGSIIKGVTASMAAVVQVGDVAADNNILSGAYSSGHTGASLMGMVVTGNASALVAVKVIGARWAIDRCQIYRGVNAALHITTGQNGYCRSSIVGQSNQGWGIISNGNDNKIIGTQVREYVTGGIWSNGTWIEITGNHIFTNLTTPGLGPDVLIDDANLSVPGGMITGNVFGDRPQSPHIVVKASAAGYPRNVMIVGNEFYFDTPPNKSVPVIRLDTTAGNLYNIGVMTNGVSAYGNSGAQGYKSLVDKTGANTVNNLVVVGNLLGNVEKFTTSVTPEVLTGNSTRWYDGTTTKNYLDVQAGQTTFSGDGTTTAFTVTHVLNETPTKVDVTPASSDAAVLHYVSSMTATTFVVTFKTAPASGTNNVKLNWRAAI